MPSPTQYLIYTILTIYVVDHIFRQLGLPYIPTLDGITRFGTAVAIACVIASIVAANRQGRGDVGTGLEVSKRNASEHPNYKKRRCATRSKGKAREDTLLYKGIVASNFIQRRPTNPDLHSTHMKILHTHRHKLPHQVAIPTNKPPDTEEILLRNLFCDVLARSM